MISAYNIQSEYIANFNFFIKLFTVYEETDTCLISTFYPRFLRNWEKLVIKLLFVRTENRKRSYDIHRINTKERIE